jgi:hypothetical protein
MSSAFIGQLVAGVLSTGTKVPQMSYKGDSIVDPDTIFAHLAVAPRSQSVKVKILRNGTAIQKSSADAEIEITAGNKSASVTGLDSFTVADGDYFEPNITQVGTTPNEGLGLAWGVAR